MSLVNKDVLLRSLRSAASILETTGVAIIIALLLSISAVERIRQLAKSPTQANRNFNRIAIIAKMSVLRITYEYILQYYALVKWQSISDYDDLKCCL